MEDKIALLVMRIFFSLCALLAFFSILSPELSINLTIKWYKWTMRILGLEAEIKPTAKAKAICRIWNLIGLCLFIVLFIILPKTLK